MGIAFVDKSMMIQIEHLGFQTLWIPYCNVAASWQEANYHGSTNQIMECEATLQT